MRPSEEYDVVDKHGWMTVETHKWDTLWVPARVATVGKLVDYDENAFWQHHKGVTKARYKIPGQRRLALVWLCNRTGLRVDGRSFMRPFAGECDCGKGE